LVHDVGKIAMAAAFPRHFTAVHRRLAAGPEDLLAVETAVLGLDHTELGACYLELHDLPRFMIETARYHHASQKAEEHGEIVAAVQLADLLVRYAQIGGSGNTAEVREEDWQEATCWEILLPGQEEMEAGITRASLKRSLESLPIILDGLL